MSDTVINRRVAVSWTSLIRAWCRPQTRKQREDCASANLPCGACVCHASIPQPKQRKAGLTAEKEIINQLKDSGGDMIRRVLLALLIGVGAPALLSTPSAFADECFTVDH